VSLTIFFQGIQYSVHHFELSTFLEIVLGTLSHILDLSLLFTDCSEVAKDDFELSLIAEGTEF
jgi:hypothetical protein